MKAFYAVGLLLLINAQVNSSPATLEDNDRKNFHEKLDKTKKESINEIRELENLSAEHSKLLQCYQQADIQMEQLRLDTIYDLFNCDLFKELNETVSYVQQIPGMDPNFIYNLVNSLLLCISRDQITEALCITKAYLVFSKNIESILPKFEAYELEIQVLGKEVREMFQQCAHRKDQQFKQRLENIFKERECL